MWDSSRCSFNPPLPSLAPGAEKGREAGAAPGVRAGVDAGVDSLLMSLRRAPALTSLSRGQDAAARLRVSCSCRRSLTNLATVSGAAAMLP